MSCRRSFLGVGFLWEKVLSMLVLTLGIYRTLLCDVEWWTETKEAKLLALGFLGDHKHSLALGWWTVRRST
jgi:hypothetical protein